MLTPRLHHEMLASESLIDVEEDICMPIVIESTYLDVSIERASIYGSTSSTNL